MIKYVCNLILVQHLNDLVNCHRRCNVDIIKLFISALGHARSKIQQLCSLAICMTSFNIVMLE